MKLRVSTWKYKYKSNGVALLMVLLMTSIMTIMIVELSFTARITSDVADNYQDELRALYLAKSAINYAKVFLKIDLQVGDKVQKQMQQLTQGSGLGGLQLGDLDPGAMHVWDIVPVQYPPPTEMLGALLGVESGEDSEPRQNEYDDEYEEESFSIEFEDESSKLNLNLFHIVPQVPGEKNPTFEMLKNLMTQSAFDKVFENTDNRGIREDLAYAVLDWIDNDFEATNPKKNRDENHSYYDKGYQTKNAPLFSFPELHLIEGWNDDIYEAFNKYLTVYSDGKINVAAAPKEVMGVFFNDSSNVKKKEEYVEKMMTKRSSGALDENKFFEDMAKTIGIPKVDDVFLPEVTKQSSKFITTNSRVFKVTATGLKGETKKEIVAVLDRGTRIEDEVKVLYWQVR